VARVVSWVTLHDGAPDALQTVHLVVHCDTCKLWRQSLATIHRLSRITKRSTWKSRHKLDTVHISDELRHTDLLGLV
jgi:hypothetical protein